MNSNRENTPLAVVTGAARRLGRAIALELAGRGYAVGLHYHSNQDAAERTAKEIRVSGGTATLFPADLCDPAQIDSLFERIDALALPLKVWVNSAAAIARNDLRTLEVAEWDATLALNLRAPWLCARAAARRMTSGGLVVNLTDSGAQKTWASYPAYLVSKAGLETLTRLLAKTLAPEVRVNAVAPGLILPGEGLSSAEWQRLVDRLPLRQAGTPQDIARAVMFLVENKYITGQTIVVDGGYQLI